MDLLTAERQLQAAQRDADVESLDALLHPRVVGAGPDGTVFTKEDDLAIYRSGALRITNLVEESLDVQEDGQTGMARTVAAVDAVRGAPSCPRGCATPGCGCVRTGTGGCWPPPSSRSR